MRALALIKALRVVLVALIAMAFAVDSHARTAPTEAELWYDAYLLAGNAPEWLCADSGTDHADAPGCALCHLVAHADLPAPSLRLALTRSRLVATVIQPRACPVRTRARDPATPTRGPPVTT